MGLIVGFFKLIIRLILLVSVFIAFILLIPNLPPYTKFTSIKNAPTQQRSGSLAPNDVLNKAKHLYKDKLLGPECFQVWNDEVYTSLATGEIVKLSRGGHVTFVTKIGQPCTGLTQEHICGRPLGFVIDEKNKDLLISDAYHGIWKVNIQTDKKQLLVSPRVAIDGKIPMLFNSVAMVKNGDIYWTHSSSEFHLNDGLFAIFSDPSGRLLYYNAAKNESKVLLDDLWFPNGVAVSPDEQFVVVAETNKYQLVKYYINGPKKGKSEIFITGLPGTPDNVRPLPDGSGVLVALYGVFDDENPFIIKSMAEAPLARKFLARLFRLIEIPFEYLQTHFKNHVFESIVHYIGSFSSVISLTYGSSGLIQIDWNGEIVATYYNTDDSIIHISDAIVHNGQLYTGCPHIQDYIAAVPAPPLLKEAFTKTSKQQPKIEIKKEQIKPTINEPREVPKTTKPVQKSQPSSDKPIENKQESKPASPTQPPPPAAKQPEVKNTITEESKPKVTAKHDKNSKPDVKSKVVPKDDTKPKTKDTTAKPKVEPKGAESKPQVTTKKETPKQKASIEKPKVEPKGTESKAKVATKEETHHQKAPAEKPKVEPKGAESKPQVATKQETLKQKASIEKPKIEPKGTESKPKVPEKEETLKQKAPIEKPKDVKKEPEVKPQEAQKVDKKQPVIKESSPADKNKSKDANVKQTIEKETVSKLDKKTEKVQVKPVKGSEPVKTAPKGDEAKASESKTQPTAKKLKEPRKAIPIEEEIPSDTKKPSEEKLKVIKKNGPQEIRNPNL